MRNSVKVIFTSVAIVAVAAFLIACGSPAANNTATNTKANVAPTNTKPANTTTPGNTAANSDADGKETADKIGVPECDDYMAKYEACISSKVPAAQRAVFETSFKTMKDSWAKAASTEAGKSGLAAGCKAAMESAKTSLSSFNCEW